MRGWILKMRLWALKKRIWALSSVWDLKTETLDARSEGFTLQVWF